VESLLRPGGSSGEESRISFQDAGSEDDAGTPVVQRDRKGQDAPGKGLGGGIIGLEEEAAPGAIDVGLAGFRHGAQDLVPV
jgi:hypothetical protein